MKNRRRPFQTGNKHRGESLFVINVELITTLIGTPLSDTERPLQKQEN